MAHFVDTNIVVYAQTDDPKRERAIEVLNGAIISVQVLNELTLIARRKWNRSWSEIDDLIAEVYSACASVIPVDEAVHVVGRKLADRYRLAVYDAFVVAAALIADCDTLHSEDMQDGLEIEGGLTIRNPFV